MSQNAADMVGNANGHSKTQTTGRSNGQTAAHSTATSDEAQEPPEPRGLNSVEPLKTADAATSSTEPANDPVKARRPRKTGPAVVGTPGITAQARTGIRAGAPAVKTGMKPGFRPVVVVPVYNQPQRLAEVVADIRKLSLPVILVDDGSDETTRAICDRLAEPNVRVIHRPLNSGKGAAVIVGFKAAGRAGFTHALQIDADGQHDRTVIPKFLTLGQKFPSALICGYPVYDQSVPLSRRFGRKLTNFWCAINSLSLSFEDAMCGLRLYPLEPVLALVENVKLGLRMQFDPEILVRLLWAGLRVKNIPVRVTYPEGGVSHFKAVADNVRISGMHAKLCVLMLTRLPIILFSRICGRDPECRVSHTEASATNNARKETTGANAAKPTSQGLAQRNASPSNGNGRTVAAAKPSSSSTSKATKPSNPAPAAPGTMRAYEAARNQQAKPEDLERAKRATRAAALAQVQAQARLSDIAGKRSSAKTPESASSVTAAKTAEKKAL